MAVTIKAQPQLRFRMVILAVAAVILTWLVIARSLSAYLAGVAPQSALWLSPRQPEALVSLADRSLNSPETWNASHVGDADQGPPQQKIGSETTDGLPAIGDQSPEQRKSIAGSVAANGSADSRNLSDAFETIDENRSIDVAAIRAEAVTALSKGPLNARALRILGQLADVSKDSADAMKFMSAAVQMSLHETMAVYWLMLKSTEAGDYKAAITYADALMRTVPETARQVVPVLAHFAADKTAADAVKALLHSNPPWRRLFFALLPQSVADARTPLGLLLSLKSTPTPPTSEEVGVYLTALIAHKLYDLAYYTWLQFLPADQLSNAGLLFNGNFEVIPSGMPFDWVITQGSGVTIDIVPRPDKHDERALLVDFLYGRVDYHSVSELVLLAPGTYQFNGQYTGKIVGPRGLKWRVVCADSANTRIGESAMITGMTPDWKKTDFVFTVPAADCRAQYVELDLDARMASEQLVSGSMLFAELSVSRVTGEPDSQESSE
jgi:hypothetical protein